MSSKGFFWHVLLLFILLGPFPLLGAYRYVSDSGSQTFPYDSWGKAAHNIQDAVNAANPGDTVLVTNGVYQALGGQAEETGTVVIVVSPIQVIGVNGRNATVIDGGNTSRCVYIAASNAVFRGFTLKNGSGGNGGGVFAALYAAIRDCAIVSNRAVNGGGAYLTGASLEDSEIAYNTSFYSGGGVHCWDPPSGALTWVRRCEVHHNTGCVGGDVGGGGIFARDTGIENCLVYENSLVDPAADGGGVFINYNDSVVRNCVLRDNRSPRYGGGLFSQFDALVENCTVVSNSAADGGGGVGSSYGGRYRNCVIFDNYATLFTGSSNMLTFLGAGPSYEFCCLAPLTNGAGNLNASPCLDYATPARPLLAVSPCIDAGTNQAWMTAGTDILGQPRLFNQRVDIGADEAVIACTSLASNNPVALTWSAFIGAKCQLQSSLNITGAWTSLGAPVTSTTYSIQLTDGAVPDRLKLYRLLWLKD